MTVEPFTVEELERARREHAGIFSALRLVRRGLDMIDPARPNPETLRAQLQTWNTRLVMHFNAEEKDGLIDRLASALPDEAGKLDKLREQHTEILRALSVVRERLDEGRVLDYRVLIDRLEKVKKLWSIHETMEDQLIAEAVNRANGGGTDSEAAVEGV